MTPMGYLLAAKRGLLVAYRCGHNVRYPIVDINLEDYLSLSAGNCPACNGVVSTGVEEENMPLGRIAAMRKAA